MLNLMLAALTALIAVVGSARSDEHKDMGSVAVILFAVCWLGGAVGLFFKLRLAWCGSLLGAGVMFFISLKLLASGEALMPKAHDPTDGAGYMLIFGAIGLLVSLPLIIGLFRQRKALFGSGQKASGPVPK